MKVKIQIEIEIDEEDVMYPVRIDEVYEDGCDVNKFCKWLPLRQLAKTKKDRDGRYYIFTRKKYEDELCQSAAQPITVSAEVIGGTLKEDFKITADVPGLGRIRLEDQQGRDPFDMFS